MKKRPQVRLCQDGHDAPPAPGCTVLGAELPYMGEAVRLGVEVPDCRLRLADVVPLARRVCDQFTSLAVRRVQAGGRAISCAKGCGVCCTNYLVPMTVPEAFRLMEDLQALPAAERRRLGAAFAAAERKLADSHLEEAYAKLDPSDPQSAARQRELAGEWWSKERFPCPLLREQACSLYLSRPMPCREFLVVSPPQRCQTNSETRVRRPFAMHAALARWAAELEGTHPTLVLMPNLLSWHEGKLTRSQRTWRAPGMVRRLLGILAELAARSDAPFAGPIPAEDG